MARGSARLRGAKFGSSKSKSAIPPTTVPVKVTAATPASTSKGMPPVRSDDSNSSSDNSSDNGEFSSLLVYV